jgi:hypothetical protein
MLLKMTLNNIPKSYLGFLKHKNTRMHPLVKIYVRWAPSRHFSYRVVDYEFNAEKIMT